VTWFGPGHSVRWYHEPSTFPLGAGHEAVLLLDEPGGLLGPEPPDLSGYSFGGDPVRWLWVVPITEQERLLAKEEGSSSLIMSLASEGRSWVIGGPAGGDSDPSSGAAPES
jgi:Suppressor of fused protein (SUFU)